jgi:ligand-binding sensor domain-containing protein
MRLYEHRKIIRCAVVAVTQCLTVAFWPGTPVVSAQQLSIRHYDVSDGLAHSRVVAIHQDAKGYLWLATWVAIAPILRISARPFSRSVLLNGAQELT